MIHSQSPQTYVFVYVDINYILQTCVYQFVYGCTHTTKCITYCMYVLSVQASTHIMTYTITYNNFTVVIHVVRCVAPKSQSYVAQWLPFACYRNNCIYIEFALNLNRIALHDCCAAADYTRHPAYIYNSARALKLQGIDNAAGYMWLYTYISPAEQGDITNNMHRFTRWHDCYENNN